RGIGRGGARGGPRVRRAHASRASDRRYVEPRTCAAGERDMLVSMARAGPGEVSRRGRCAPNAGSMRAVPKSRGILLVEDVPDDVPLALRVFLRARGADAARAAWAVAAWGRSARRPSRAARA